MSGTMKWFIFCAAIIFFGLGFLIGAYSGLTFIFVDDKITDYHRDNLLIIYQLTPEE